MSLLFPVALKIHSYQSKTHEQRLCPPSTGTSIPFLGPSKASAKQAVLQNVEPGHAPGSAYSFPVTHFRPLQLQHTFLHQPQGIYMRQAYLALAVFLIIFSSGVGGMKGR